jgi:long-chain acyl-CoA synthetase
VSAAATFRDAIDARADDAPFALAPERDDPLTGAALREATDAFEATFEGWGVAAGDTVGFMLPNGFAALQLFIGTMATGRIVMPFNLLAQDAQLDHLLAHAAPRVVFAAGEHAERLEAAAARARVMTRIERCDPNVPQWGQATPHVRVRPREHDIAMLMYTSGTTGVPKAVPLSHANMLHAGRAVAAHQSLVASDRVLSSLPLYHINGQCIATVSTLVSGGSVVLPSRFSTSQWWSLVERFRPTWLNLVPTIVAYLLSGPEPTPAQHEAARNVRYARSASAPLPPEQQCAFEERFGIPIVEAMGLTESASIAFCNPMPPQERRIGSAGRPLGIRARIVDREGRELPDGERGEIQIAGPSVMKGYWRAPAETIGLTADGWLATGDLGYRDAEGFYFVTGRLKELIIKGGENIAPREIDEALLKHPAVLEAAAVGVPDRDYGQEILACIVVKPGATLTEDELRAHCLSALGRYKSPALYRFVDALPKGPSGKVQRMKLAERWSGS